MPTGREYIEHLSEVSGVSVERVRATLATIAAGGRPRRLDLRPPQALNRAHRRRLEQLRRRR